MPLALRSNDETQSPLAVLPSLAPESQEAPTGAVEAQVPTRDETLDILLAVHDKEEVRRSKSLYRFNVATITLIGSLFIAGGIRFYLEHLPPGFASAHTIKTINNCLFWFCFALSAILFLIMRKISGRSFSDMFFPMDARDEWRHTPLCSSRVQQDTITALLNHADSPRVAEALCRALTYYTGDKNVLYLRLARVLPLLPNDPEFLTPMARRILRSHAGAGRYALAERNQQNLPVLAASARDYLARTDKGEANKGATPL